MTSKLLWSLNLIKKINADKGTVSVRDENLFTTLYMWHWHKEAYWFCFTYFNFTKTCCTSMWRDNRKVCPPPGPRGDWGEEVTKGHSHFSTAFHHHPPLCRPLLGFNQIFHLRPPHACHSIDRPGWAMVGQLNLFPSSDFSMSCEHSIPLTVFVSFLCSFYLCFLRLFAKRLRHCLAND